MLPRYNRAWWHKILPKVNALLNTRVLDQPMTTNETQFNTNLNPFKIQPKLTHNCTYRTDIYWTKKQEYNFTRVVEHEIVTSPRMLWRHDAWRTVCWGRTARASLWDTSCITVSELEVCNEAVSQSIGPPYCRRIVNAFEGSRHCRDRCVW